MVNLVINLPSAPVQQLPSISAFAGLRALPSAGLTSGQDYAVDGSGAFGDGGGGLFVWNPSSMELDDNATVIRPNDITALQAGRWLLAGGDQIKGLIDVATKFTQAGSGSVTQNITDKLLQSVQTVRDKGALPDGTTNARAAFAAADAIGAFVIPRGLYFIASSITIANNVVFDPGARLVIPNGVTVTFNGNVDAGEYQIFNLTGTGAVRGLAATKLAWFAGDIVNLRVNAPSFIQKAYDATVDKGLLEWVAGDLYSDGTQINAARSVSTQGKDRHLSRLLFTTANTTGLYMSSGDFQSVTDMTFNTADSGIIATSGKCLSFDPGYNCLVDRCIITNTFVGIQFKGNVLAIRKTDINGAMSTSMWLYDGANVAISDSSCSAFSDWVVLSSTLNFIGGESISWPGGTGSYGYGTTGVGTAKIFVNDTPPAIGATITGVTSGATGTVTSYLQGHSDGGLRLENNSPATVASNSAWAGGKTACYITAPNNTHGQRPEYSFFTNCYFDHAENGLIADFGTGFSFTNCWFVGRYGDGVSLSTTLNFSFYNCIAEASWNNGYVVTANTKGFRIAGGNINGNNRSNNSKSGVFFFANTTDFAITNCRIGGATGYGGTQRYGVDITPGTSDRYIVTGNLVSGNTLGGVQDGGTGVNKQVANNY